MVPIPKMVMGRSTKGHTTQLFVKIIQLQLEDNKFPSEAFISWFNLSKWKHRRIFILLNKLWQLMNPKLSIRINESTSKFKGGKNDINCT
jgi:hypothetical protein